VLERVKAPAESLPPPYVAHLTLVLGSLPGVTKDSPTAACSLWRLYREILTAPLYVISSDDFYPISYFLS